MALTLPEQNQTCLLSYLFCVLSTDKRGSRIFRQGGDQAWLSTTFLFFVVVFLVLNLFYNFTEGVQWLFQGNYNFPRFQRGSNIFQMLISIETHLTCDFPGGSGHLSPPLDPHMTHLCTKMRSTENNVCVILIDAYLFGIDQRQLCRFVSLSYMVCLFSYASDGKNKSLDIA